MTIKLTPNDDHVIVKLIEQPDTIGESKIILTSTSKAKSTLAEVMVAAQESYYRNGELRPQARFKAGDKVRLPKNAGTGVLEAPDDEQWLAVREDEIIYKVEEI